MDSVHWTVHFSHTSDLRHLMAFALIRSVANQEGAQAKTATEDSCAIQRGELASFPSSAPDEAVKKDLAERVSRVAQLEAASVPWHTASCRYLMSSRCIINVVTSEFKAFHAFEPLILNTPSRFSARGH